jgi:transcriptional regulator with XRE-family HTH domain
MTASTGEERRGLDPAAPERGTIPQDTFAGRLKLVRLHAGNLTIMQAAERCGLLNQSWSNWENGKVPRDKDDIVLAISEALGIDKDWLMWGGPLAKPIPRARRRSRHTDWPENTSGYSRKPAKRTNRPPVHSNGFRRPGSVRRSIAA